MSAASKGRASSAPQAHAARRLALISAALTATAAAAALAGLIAWSDGVPLDPAAVVQDLPADQDALAAPVVRSDDWLVVRPVVASAFAGVAPMPDEQGLADAPDPDLAEPTPLGPLPKIAADGRLPAQAYARSFDRADDRSRLVVIVAGIGLVRAASEAAIATLPASTTLAIDAYAARPGDWARLARRAGHEVVIGLPLQAATARPHDTDPQGLRADDADAPAVSSLETLLASVPGAIGVLLTGGREVVADTAVLRPVAAALGDRGLLLVDDTHPDNVLLRSSAGGAAPMRVRVDVVLDDPPDASAIDRQLSMLMAHAREHFFAVAVARPLPVTLRWLRDWIGTLDHARYVLAPVSAVADVAVRPQ